MVILDFQWIKKVFTVLELFKDATTVLSFWKEKSSCGNKVYEVLSNLASHPTTTDVERLFSTAGDIITNERNRLNPATVEKIKF